jgi:hypothetical protein
MVTSLARLQHSTSLVFFLERLLRIRLHWTTRQSHSGYVKCVTNMAMHYVIAHRELTSLIYTTFDSAHGREITCSSLNIADLTINTKIMA